MIDGNTIYGVKHWRDCTLCLADISPADGGDRVVNVSDLAAVIDAWNKHGPSDGDADHNGIVDVDDLITVITGWGPCP